MESTKRDLLILCKKNGINRIRLNVDGIVYIMDRENEHQNMNIIYGDNIISERVKLPKVHLCKGKTVLGKRCKNKTYYDFCNIH
jgi:hypothetical protein